MPDPLEALRSLDASAILAAHPDGIVAVDAAGRIRGANDTALRLFGYGWGELDGRPVEDLVPHRLRRRHVRQRHEYERDPHARSMGVGLRLQGQRRDGSLFDCDISLTPVQHRGERWVLATVRDISQRIQLETELARLRQEFEARAGELV